MIFYREQKAHEDGRQLADVTGIFLRGVKKIPVNSPSLSVLSVDSSEPCERVRNLRRSSAFSLIEVLVAMAVMTVIIVMVTNMFRDASEAWDIGAQRAEMNTSARAAIGYITRELSCAVAGSIPDSTGGVAIIKPFVLINGTNMSFTALSGEDQALRGIRFGYDSVNRIIVTTNETANFNDPNWLNWGPCLLITNVWSFWLFAYSNEYDMSAGNFATNYNSSDNSNLLPACVDISIEMLGERDMTRALSITPAGSDAQLGYVMTNSRVYTARVCFPNRGGGGK